MTNIERGELINEGKTKKIFAIVGNDGQAIVEYKNAITAFDDPSFTKEFATKAKYSNTTTCRAFEILNRAGIPTSYVKQLSDTEFIAERCAMIPLEVVARRYAFGSYLKRHPEYSVAAGEPPHRFDTPVVEFFLKTTKGGLKDSAGAVIVEGLDPKKGEEDPFIQNPYDAQWKLLNPKLMESDPESSLNRTIDSVRVLNGATIDEMEKAIIAAIEALEGYLSTHDFKLVDFKIEFGMTQKGKVVISDVIDNDSWRLRDKDWKDVSKQSFRDGEDMSKIEDKYALVAALMEESKQLY